MYGRHRMISRLSCARMNLTSAETIDYNRLNRESDSARPSWVRLRHRGFFPHFLYAGMSLNCNRGIAPLVEWAGR